MKKLKAPSYDNCPHVQCSGLVEVLDCSMCDEKWTAWVTNQPWYSRLDEWQHRHFHGRLWLLMWRPLCNFTDWMYRR